MKNTNQILLLIAVVVLCAGLGYFYITKQEEPAPPIVGGDRDEHGCIGSAGYSWCEEKQKCLRIWEESCASNCVVENCHGMDIECGSNPPQACTEIYMIGDKCLQYATCGIREGKCQQLQNPQFNLCKSCVQNCMDTNTTDPTKLFECESSCK